MEFSYKEIKQGLTKYFTKVEKYRKHSSNVNENIIYFISFGHEYEIIILSNTPLNEIVNEEILAIKTKLQKSVRQIIKEVVIIIDPTQNTIVNDDNKIDIICGEVDLKTNLQNTFVRINELSIKKESDEAYIKKASKVDVNNNYDEPQTSEEIKNEFLQFQSNLRANRLTTTWVIMAAFAVIPFILIFVTMQLNISNMATYLGLDGLQKLFTGGTNYNLTIAGEQGWRILTYGFAISSSTIIMNIIIIATCGFGLFLVSRLSENTTGPVKMLISFIAAYALTGFFSSVMMSPDYITGGILPVLAIMTGILVMSIALENGPKASFTRVKLVWPIVLLIIIPLLEGGTKQYITIIVGFAAGGMIQMLIKRGLKRWNWTFIIPVFILAALIILPIVFIWIPRYISAIDYNVIWTLKLYIDKNLLGGIDKANVIVGKIGWDVIYRLGDNNYVSYIVG